MRWTLWRWVWKLESPLYIGMPPAGSLNRCRLYVPARNIWAAITEKLARGKSSNSFPDYEQVGKCLRENARFTYLFPAESRGKDWIAWLPEFAEEDGLRWRKCGTQETKSDRDFRGMLLDTRPGTALEPTSRTAAEGTLRETECVYALWRHQAEGETKPVGLVGYVFLREQKLACDLKKIERLAIGGDTRYGLGRLKQVNMEQAADVFGLTVVLDKKDPIVRSKTVLAHIPQNCAPCMRGGLEILAGWKRDASKKTLEKLCEKPFWTPGSVVLTDEQGQERQREQELDWEISEDGFWIRSDERSGAATPGDDSPA